MALAPGARLGPYEIIGPLGSGGMGVVSADSRRFLVNTVVDGGVSPAITIALNWMSVIQTK